VKTARREIEEISNRKVETIVLTHFHSDHTRALPAFSDCRIISSNLLLKNLKLAGRKAPARFRLTFPSETFDRQLELRDKDIRLLIRQAGTPTAQHTSFARTTKQLQLATTFGPNTILGAAHEVATQTYGFRL
jgi:glyoxylase-like metal-dependent hydrolase (beta-lactamase superfamily II)